METSDIEQRFDEEQQFWDELEATVNKICSTQQQIDEQLKVWLRLISDYRDDFLQSEHDIAKCGFRLLESRLFVDHKHYVRRRLVGRFLKEPSNSPKLHAITSTLLYDGVETSKSFELMVEQNAFGRIVELIWKEVAKLNFGFHKLLLEVFYEMCRIQRLRFHDLDTIQDDFVKYLLEQVEEGQGDPDDPYNYAVIKVLLVLNEQYMVTEHSGQNNGPPLTNKVVKILSFYGPDFKTFGENIILLLNRETDTSTQLLILKLLFLLFTTTKTYEYFYTNDLCVLVDVMIRSLSDLPEEEDTLRHMYLRVLHPLLSHTQLRHPPHYKRAEILRLLQQLSNSGSQHFSPADPTTIRLVSRCNKVDWLDSESPTEKKPSNTFRPPLHLGMSLENPGSTMSVIEVATVKEKPTAEKSTKKRERGAPPPPPPGRVRGTWGGLEKMPEIKIETPVSEVGKTTINNGSLRRRPPPPPIPSARSIHSAKSTPNLKSTANRV